MEGTRAVATRMEQTRARFRTHIAEITGLSDAQATRVANFYMRHKLVQFDNVGGQFFFKHGAFAEPDVMLRALEETS